MEIPRPSKQVKKSTESAITQVSKSFYEVRNSLRPAHLQNFLPISSPKKRDEDKIQVKKEANPTWTDSEKIGDIKKEYYGSNNQCKICGMIITRYFRGHISTHYKKQKKFSKNFLFEQKNNSLQIKCKLCSKQFDLYDTDKKLEDHLSNCKKGTQLTLETLIETNDDDEDVGIYSSLFESSEPQKNMFHLSDKSPTKNLEDGPNSVLVEQLQQELEQTKKKLDNLMKQQSGDRANFMNLLQTNHSLQKQIENNRSEIELYKSFTKNLKKEIRDNKNELNLMKQDQIKTNEHLNSVIETTGMLKTQVNNTEKKVEEMAPRLEVVEKKTDDLGKTLQGLLNYLIEKTEQPIQNETRGNIFNRIVIKTKENQTNKTIEIKELKIREAK